MTYTAFASLIILGDDLSMTNRQALVAGVRALRLPDGSSKAWVFCIATPAFVTAGQGPGLEASLSLMGRLGDLRPNKPEDTSNSFWIGATLSLPGKLDMIDYEIMIRFVLNTRCDGRPG